MYSQFLNGLLSENRVSKDHAEFGQTRKQVSEDPGGALVWVMKGEGGKGRESG